MLACSDVERRFGGLVAVTGVNFQIERGEIFGLVGPNGSGKSNLSDAIRQGELAYSESRFEDANQNQPGALQWFLAVLRFDAENAEAKTGLENTLDALILVAGKADREGDLAVSERLLQIIGDALDCPLPPVTPTAA